MSQKRIIFDCDLTMGIPDCDIDDGLALLYALGYEKEHPGSVDIEGICTSYGNNELEVVHRNTVRICKDLALDIDVVKGAADAKHPQCDAAGFLVEKANSAPGEISLCVTGATTNLKGALQLDDRVLSKFREVVFMGGITQTLVFNGKIMDELNYSSDPEAAFLALSSANTGANIVVMTANHCLPAHFMPDEFSERLTTPESDGGYLLRTCRSWFDTLKRWYALDGFCCWDVLASAYILEPHLFVDEPFEVLLNPTLLKAGYIEQAFSGAPTARINTPQIADPKAFCDRAYDLWRKSIA